MTNSLAYSNEVRNSWRSSAEVELAKVQDMLRRKIQMAKMTNSLDPEVVAAYAYLHLTTDDGVPIIPADHHWLWLRLLCDERIKNLLIVAPPESAKTTWAVLAYIGTYVGFYPERSVIIGSVSGGVAERRAVSLRTSTESDAWRTTFPDVLPVSAGLPYSATQWSLAPNGKPHPGRLHPTVAAFGTGGSVVGSRADLILGDDLLDFDNTRTAHQRLMVETWFHNSLRSRAKSKTGRVIVIGTAWHQDDLIGKARSTNNWVVCHTPLLSEGKDVYATLTYPDWWPYEKIGSPISDERIPA